MRPFLLLAALLLAGCGTTGKHWWSPATWGSSRPAERVEKAEVALGVAQDRAIRSARAEVVKTETALASAPVSRPVEVARRTSANARGLLDQVAGPLTSEEAADIRTLVADLLSENAAIRAEAEARQAQDEGKIADQSRRLAQADAALEAANGKLAAAFARENALADELRNERARRWWILGGCTLTVLILLAGWIYVQVVSGGIPRALGTMLRGLPTKEAESIRALLDPVLNRIEQAAIRKHT